MLRKLDEVCRRAQDLAKVIQAQMVAQARSQYPVRPDGKPERRKAARKKRD
jgi:hypothetical protein